MEINNFLTDKVVEFLRSGYSNLEPKILPLNGKYYGTIINLGGTAIKIWMTNCDFENELCYTPSDRELIRHNITLDQWKNNEVINDTPAKEILEMGTHVEDQLSYLTAMTFVETFEKLRKLYNI